MLKKQVFKPRSIVKPQAATPAQLEQAPKDKPGVIYVRQSSDAQVRRNLHSYEMQTHEFVKYFKEQGYTGNIKIVADDEGKSGTLDIHDRDGLAYVVRLIEGKELLDGERIGWVGAVYVNRLTRDEWLIVPGVLMRECFENDVWIITLRMAFNFKDDYCKRVFIIEAEDAARQLTWMKTIMFGAKQIASSKGLYDGRPIMPGYVVDHREKINDEPNKGHRKYIIYEPHAEIVRWLYRRYLELNGNLHRLYREIREKKYLFPPLEEKVGKVRISLKQSCIEDGPYKGYYLPSHTRVRGILTNPVYLGWWLPLNGGLIEKNHVAIVDPKFFWFAFDRLSMYNLEGQRRKLANQPTRNGKGEGLLKEVGKGVYATISKGVAIYRTESYAGDGRVNFSVQVSKIDPPFVIQLFKRLDEWVAAGMLADWRERLEQVRNIQNTRREHIKKSIKEAEDQIARIIDLLIGTSDTRLEADLRNRHAGLSEKLMQLKADLAQAGTTEEQEAETLFKIWELIPLLKAKWHKLAFGERLTVVNAFTRSVEISLPSPGWI